MLWLRRACFFKTHTFKYTLNICAYIYSYVYILLYTYILVVDERGPSDRSQFLEAQSDLMLLIQRKRAVDE